MRSYVTAALTFTILTGVLSHRAFAAVGSTGPPIKTYDLSASNITGEVIRGPRRLIATHLNVLRYDYKFSTSITFSQTPDLWSRLTQLAVPSVAKPPAVPTPAPTPAPPAAEAAPHMFPGPPLSCEAQLKQEGRFPPDLFHDICRTKALKAQVDARTNTITGSEGLASQVLSLRSRLQEYVQAANCATERVTSAGKALKGFLANSTGEASVTIAGISAQLADNGGGNPCAQAAGNSNDSTFVLGIKAQWPASAGVGVLAVDAARLDGALAEESKLFPVFASTQSAAIAVLELDLQADIAALDKGKLFGGSKEKAKAAKQELKERLATLADAKRELEGASALLAWATAESGKLLAGIPELQAVGQKFMAFRDARELLVTWRGRMAALRSRWEDYQKDSRKAGDPFSAEATADCEFAFARTKTTAVTLARSDQMPGTTAATAETVLSVSIECTSPFSVSAGVAFSSIREHEFAIQPVATPPGATTTRNEFVATAKSGFHPLPLAVVHARLYEPADWFALYGSFGLAGNLRSESSGGSDAEYLLGPSVGLFRTMFITLGVHIGREVALGAGFAEGDPVPANITAPPLKKAYKPAFGLAITLASP